MKLMKISCLGLFGYTKQTDSQFWDGTEVQL